VNQTESKSMHPFLILVWFDPKDVDRKEEKAFVSGES
jgi:hypothetical protein